MSKAIEDARRLIESRLTEIEAEAGELRRAIAGLGEGSAPRRGPGRSSRLDPAAATRPKRTTRRRKGSKRAARGRRREELLAAIKAAPGASPSELAKTIGIRPSQAHALIAKARSEKLIAKKGKGYTLKS